MKNYFKIATLALFLGFTVVSCRDANKEADKDLNVVEGVEMQEDAEIKVKDDKIKMEDSEKEVKVKLDEETGAVEKVKVDPKEE